MPQLKVRSVLVREGRLDFDLEVPLRIAVVDERTASCVLGLLPNLAHHVCINERGATFGDEIVGTELAHLFEHLVVELQGQAHEGVRAGYFKGHTSWLAELSETRPQGIALMRVTVSFANDLVALQAAKDARAILEWALESPSTDPAAGPAAPEAPDIPAMVGQLRRLRRMM